jgi:hypothetical protein
VLSYWNLLLETFHALVNSFHVWNRRIRKLNLGQHFVWNLCLTCLSYRNFWLRNKILPATDDWWVDSSRPTSDKALVCWRWAGCVSSDKRGDKAWSRMWIRLIRDKVQLVFSKTMVCGTDHRISWTLFCLLFILTKKLIVYLCENSHDCFLLNRYLYWAPQRRSNTDINYGR